ncbi:CBS domain-containing protein [Streptomyces sp. NPDC005573]|uniref:CBS domain-containing protein n=1 Tax=unclassified Streptomyces TaxID=2593676 RepID=UPI0033B4D23E
MFASPQIVSEVMTHTVVSVGRWASFKDIVGMMQEWRVSALPVLEGEGRVVGVVSEADLLPTEELRDSPERGYALLRPADVVKAGAVTAGDLMSSPAITVRADATLAEAARVMAREKVKRLPVVDEAGLLEGVVSRADLLTVFLRDDEDIAEEVRRDIVAYLFPLSSCDLHVEVHDGVATLTGRVRDTALVPVAARLVRAVEGVVDVEFDLARDAVRHAPHRTEAPHEQGPVGPGASGGHGR